MPPSWTLNDPEHELLLMISFAARAPAALGWNPSVTVAGWPSLTTLDDSVPTLKSAGCRPPKNMPVIVSGESPSSKIVIVRLGPGLPVWMVPKFTPGGLTSIQRSIAPPFSGIWNVLVVGVGVGVGVGVDV